MTGKPTPTPWRINHRITDGGAPMIEGCNRWIAKVYFEGGSEDPEVHANAALIVRAVNAHEALVEALEGIHPIIERQCERFIPHDAPPEMVEQIRQTRAHKTAMARVEAIRAALALARGETT